MNRPHPAAILSCKLCGGVAHTLLSGPPHIVRRDDFLLASLATFPAPGDRDAGYQERYCREGRRLRQSPVTWVHALLACALAPAAILPSLAGLVAPVGNTLRSHSRKDGETGGVPHSRSWHWQQK